MSLGLCCSRTFARRRAHFYSGILFANIQGRQRAVKLEAGRRRTKDGRVQGLTELSSRSEPAVWNLE